MDGLEALPLLELGDTLQHWQEVMLLYLETQGLKIYVTEAPSRLSAQRKKTNDIKTNFILNARVDASMKDKMRAVGWTIERTAYETWHDIEQAVSDIPETYRKLLFEELNYIQRNKFKTMDAYLSRITFLCNITSTFNLHHGRWARLATNGIKSTHESLSRALRSEVVNLHPVVARQHVHKALNREANREIFEEQAGSCPVGPVVGSDIINFDSIIPASDSTIPELDLNIPDDKLDSTIVDDKPNSHIKQDGPRIGLDAPHIEQNSSEANLNAEAKSFEPTIVEVTE